MPLPTSGELSFQQIKAEFQGSDSFADYYRGGPYVPNIAGNEAISTTAEGLAFSQFYGARKTNALYISPASSEQYTLRGQTITQLFTAVNAQGAVTWSFASGGTGLTITNHNNGTCTVRGTSTAGAATITRNATLRATVSGQGTADATISWTYEGTA